MKKFFYAIFFLFIIVGCGERDSEYLYLAQHIELAQTTEISGYELKSFNDMASFMLMRLTNENSLETVKEKSEWRVAGKLNGDSRMIEIKYKEAVVNFPVKKSGDYLMAEPMGMSGKNGDIKYTWFDLVQELSATIMDKQLKMLEDSMDKIQEKEGV
jgi:hypothetical protein